MSQRLLPLEDSELKFDVILPSNQSIVLKMFSQMMKKRLKFSLVEAKCFLEMKQLVIIVV